jgi:hypothetical protein
MSIRRKSCEPCFKGRRKCDLTSPACGRCQRNGKHCRYKYPPQHLANEVTIPEGAIGSASGSAVTVDLVPWEVAEALHGIKDLQDLHGSHGESLLIGDALFPHLPSEIGVLEYPSPLSFNSDPMWSWIISQFQSYPRSFAQKGETTFIHRDLYQDTLPQSIRAAFGICAASMGLTKANRSILFRSLDDEILNLLVATHATTLLEDLARLQAIVFYQIIRLFHGDLSQRATAEQQESIIEMWVLRLLRRADIELGTTQAAWETWILAESIRRTAFTAIKLYSVYMFFRTGVCTAVGTMSLLPVSTRTSSWNSRERRLLELPSNDEVKTYKEFKALWSVVPGRKVTTFEQLVVAGCPEVTGSEMLDFSYASG